MRTRVLLIEDDTSIQQVFRFILRSTNYQLVGICGSGGSALDQCIATKPDVIVLDYRLPGCDGLEVLQRIRAFGITKPVIMYSAYHDDLRVIGCLKAGANGFLLKTAGREVLLEALNFARESEGFFVDEPIRSTLHALCAKALASQ